MVRPDLADPHREQGMSEYGGYRCTTHKPPLDSERWFNRGTGLLEEAFTLERAGLWPNDPKYDPRWPEPMPVGHDDSQARFTAPIHWLRDHPHCQVVLVNEYGETRPIAATIEGEAC